MRPNLNSMSLLLLFLALCAGCKKEEAPAPAPAQPRPAASAPKAAPVQQQLSSVTAGGTPDFSKRKDPFKAPAVAPPPQAAGQPAPRPGAPLSADLLPIQSYEVSKFKVAGIIAGLKENRALVIDPAGKGYVVQAGTEIGNAGGRISRITSSTVEVVERFKESGGRTKSRTIVLTLAKKR